MPGLRLLTLTTLVHIIPGSLTHVGLTSLGPSANEHVQYDDDHQLRRLQSHHSSTEANNSARDLLKTIFREVSLMLNSLSPNLHEPDKRRKNRRSLPDSISEADSRMFKQIWDAYSRHKYQNQVAEDRYFFFPNFDSWADSFTMYFWRDMAFNVLKIVGLSALYYLAPGVLAWYTQTFGNTV